MQSTALGRWISFPITAQPSVQALRISAFIGLPCPKKMAGIGFDIFILLALFVRRGANNFYWAVCLRRLRRRHNHAG
jgi:hypothetical protein